MRQLKTFQLVVAATRSLGIGKNGTMPWRLPLDMAYFKELTSKTLTPGAQNAVIMGRRTWESIPEKFRPLPGRINVVLSRSPSAGENNENVAENLELARASFEGAHTASSLEAALELLSSKQVDVPVEHVFVIGGGQVYVQAIASDSCDAIHLTQIDADIDCDTFFPPIPADKFRLWSATRPQRDGDVRHSFLCYTRADRPMCTLPPGVKGEHEEQQYLRLTQSLVDCGTPKGDRTGTGTLSSFGETMRFNLRHSFPLLTTKRVFFRGVAEELLWFIRGCTDARVLQQRGVRIWDGNSSREYLDRCGLTQREEGDLGPIYGFQWRHFGAKYTDMHADYTGQGVDQLADVIHKIRNTPDDRRIVLTAWNPAALPEMALPPCHMFCQFYVAAGELSCQMYQRSCDVGLGVPFNIASYALLTCMIAQVCDLRPGDFVHVLGDAHVYANHVEPLKVQLKNAPRHFPTLKINPDKRDIDSFVFEDFELVGYKPHATIKMDMAV